MSDKKIDIYTDGSCLGNPGPGGWGVIILYEGKEYKISGGEKATTNNRMEMKAIIEGLKWFYKESKIPKEKLQDYKINFYSDSNLIIQTLNQGWKRKANTDLWAEIDSLRGWLNINWVWVKAHANNKYNNLVDKLAFSEAEKF